MPTPKVNPVSTAAERKLEIHPIRNSHMTMKSRPATNTMAAPIETASAEPAAANDSTAAPSTAAIDELGPWVTCFDVENSAKAMRPNAAA